MLTDSQRTYAEAADRVNDPQLKELLMKFGNSRAPMIEELANELARMHEDVPMEGTPKAELQRTWNSIKEKFSNGDHDNILSECARSEKDLVKRYDKAIANEDIPHHVRAMLQEHRVLLNSDVNDLITLEKTH